MRERIVAGNWKMNTTLAESISLAHGIAETTRGVDDVTVVVFPPATHLVVVSVALKGTLVGMGAQNVHWEDQGAYTGELSPLMLREVDCHWVIIGHSERRQLFGETDQSVNKRLHGAIRANLRPIVCVGETLEEREAGHTFTVLERQLRASLDGVILKGSEGVVIAYEPVWAIGTGRNATPEQAQEVHRFIRDLLAELSDEEAAANTVIQYGGSVNEKNAVDLMNCEDIDGGLIGGASLKAESFAAIVKAASLKKSV